MRPDKTIFIFILVALLNLPRQIAAQDTQEAFSQALIEACMEPDSQKVKELVKTHRLWVRPVVDEQVTEYIHRTMSGNKRTAQKRMNGILLIAQTFLDIYGEESLYKVCTYLQNWSLEQLGKKAQADRIYGMATRSRLEGKADEALYDYGRALDLYSDIGDLRGQGEALGGMGALYWYMDSDTCLMYYQEALQARKQSDDKVRIGAMLNGIGSVFFLHFGMLDSARHYYKVATELREEIGDLAGLGTSMFNLAAVYDDLSDIESALHCYERSYAVHQELGNQKFMAESKLRSGTNLRQLGRYPEALHDLEIAEDLSQIISDTIILADTYTQLALVFDNIGDYSTGIELVTTATQLYQQYDDPWGMAGVYNHTGIILQDAGRKVRAEEFYQKALDIYKQLDDQINVIRVLNNLGTVIFEQDDFIRAETYNRQALELSRNLEYMAGELPCLINLANTQNRLNQLDTAIRNYELALKLAGEMNSPDSKWRILVGMAENYKLRGDYPRAIDYNEKGLNIIEELRSTFHSASERSNYLARERYAFEDVIHMLTIQHEKEAEKGYDLLAFEYAQRCKSRSFLEQIEGSDPVTMERLLDSGLNKNSVLLEYSLGDSSSVMWVITPDASKMIRLPDRKTLEDLVETFRFALMNPDQDNLEFLQQAGHALYKYLIEPAEPFMSRKSRIIVLPDGILHYIPFEALITREPSSGKVLPYTKLHYLGIQYPISYGQSASAYLTMIDNRFTVIRAQHQTKELLAVGDPDYQGKFKKLTYSGQEVQNIGSLFPEDKVIFYTGGSATEEQIKNGTGLSGYRYVHFATHGVLDDVNPGRSGLVLSQHESGTDDGILRAEEITELHLNADLVVLSACETGIGKMIRGEGMIGLSRSFLYAGAPAVIVSLWAVSDQSTSLLMQRFYENLVVEYLSKAEALQQARISLLKDEQYAHPFFWAPFVLNGDWQ